MGDINHSIGALFLLGSVLLGYQDPTGPTWYIMAICGIILVLYPRDTGSDE